MQLKDIASNIYIQQYSCYMLDSFYKLTGKQLVERNGLIQDAALLYTADFVVLCHDTHDDPIFNYANLSAQKLWELSWDDFLMMPSRLSAEPVEIHKRKKMLDDARQKGLITNYEGVRISNNNKRFYISNAIIWNVYDALNHYVGQAATFDQWQYL